MVRLFVVCVCVRAQQSSTRKICLIIVSKSFGFVVAGFFSYSFCFAACPTIYCLGCIPKHRRRWNTQRNFVSFIVGGSLLTLTWHWLPACMCVRAALCCVYFVKSLPNEIIYEAVE